MKIGLVIMLAVDRDGRSRPYVDIRQKAKAAEEAGFDSLWLYDHLLYREEGQPTIGIWECWTVLSALAEATRKVELGTLVSCTQFRNPALLAKMACTVDEISGGRLTLGVGAGWNKPEFDAFGYPFDHRVDRFEEALQILCPLLKDGRADFQGEYYSARDCEIAPRGARVSGPPLMVAAFGSRMLRLAARYGDLWNTGYWATPDTCLEAMQQMDAACAEACRDPSTLSRTVMVALAYPHLADLSTFITPNLHGTTGEIAAAMRGYEAMGVSHLMFHVAPYTDETIQMLAGAARLYREGNEIEPYH